MLRHTRTALVMFALAAGVSSFACGGSTQTDPPQEQTVITSPKTGLKVTSAISAATLGDSSANVQIAFIAEAATTGAAVEVVSVELLDAATGSVVDTLTASAPQVWNGSSYSAWNQRVTPGGDLKASYQLTAPDWSTLDKGGSAGRTSYSKAYKLRITLRIDGIDVLMQSGELNREAQFQT